MCNADPQQMAWMEQTVRQFLDEGRMFTAYDVTIETREREGVQMRHKDVRGACHEIQVLQDAVDFGYDDPNTGQPVGWSKSQVSMGNGWAFVYHPSNVDPNGYQPRQTHSPASAQASTSISAATGPSISTTPPTDSGSMGTPNSDGTYNTDYRNRLMVPTKYLRDAGLSPGDECIVVADKQNKLLLLTGDDSNLDGTVRITTQRVERNGDLRLSSTTLKQGEFDDDKFVIENTDQNGTACVVVKS